MDLAGIYPHWEVRAADPLAWVGIGAAIVLVAVLWLLCRKIGRGPLAGLLFFAVTLSPVLGFVDFNFMLVSFVADRYQYLASIGVTTVVTALVPRGIAALRQIGVMRGKVENAVLIVLVLAALGALAWRHASLYRDGSRFFAHVVSYNPTARDAHLNLGSELLSRNRPEEALDAYRIAEEQRPDDCKPPYGAGVALYHLGRIEESEDAYVRALDRCPRYGKALTDFVQLRLDQQRYEDAQPSADPEVVTVVDDRLGAERAPFLVVIELDARVLVIDVQQRLHALRDHPRARICRAGPSAGRSTPRPFGTSKLFA